LRFGRCQYGYFQRFQRSIRYTLSSSNHVDHWVWRGNAVAFVFSQVQQEVNDRIAIFAAGHLDTLGRRDNERHKFSGGGNRRAKASWKRSSAQSVPT
jgi:hypothetical protein